MNWNYIFENPTVTNTDTPRMSVAPKSQRNITIKIMCLEPNDDDNLEQKWNFLKEIGSRGSLKCIL